MTTSEGSQISSHTDLAKEVVGFFQKLIRTTDERVTGCPPPILNELITKSFSNEANDDLTRPVTPDEIRSTMFGIDGDKAPGPDGFTAQFFKSSWTIVGGDVVRAISYFFHTNKLHPALI